MKHILDGGIAGAIARYDKIAAVYDRAVGDPLDDPVAVPLFGLLPNLEGRRVLDLACGQGRVSRELARRAATQSSSPARKAISSLAISRSRSPRTSSAHPDLSQDDRRRARQHARKTNERATPRPRKAAAIHTIRDPPPPTNQCVNRERQITSTTSGHRVLTAYSGGRAIGTAVVLARSTQ
jgi:SAM-dependent methyltransferase